VLVGYLAAGCITGPATPGFVADVGLSSQLAEIGVMLLMFGVGLHFSIEDLLSVRRIALPGALVQITVATLLGIGITAWWGWSLPAGIVFGLALSVAVRWCYCEPWKAALLETINGPSPWAGLWSGTCSRFSYWFCYAAFAIARGSGSDHLAQTGIAIY
jgi:CPA2 family monovalent cation:H+ antiporter-2